MAAAPALNLLFNCNQMQTLNGSNFKKWKQDLELCLGYSNYEHVLNEDPPAELTPTSTREAKDKYAQWHKHNRMALVIMKRSMSEAVKGGIPDAKLARMKFDGVGSIREYILKGTEIAAKLKALGVTIDDPFLVHLILNSLPSQYSQLECNYNTQKEK
ncbi:uncharacterized protein LOC112185262 [Rosa chinensis]|uniref:uncharacterized protein LOC112185262 n=1 Tax=Rosa chinensis TaxID=74649 RepID=UPI000D093490|nr:uncharacterized protein LOC112185262 [Rosa chinensis]